MLRRIVRACSSIGRWPSSVWLSILGLVLVLRFPVKFALEPHPYLMDFSVFHAVAERVTRGEGWQLYEPTSTTQMMFKYGPCWAAAFAPLGWLSEHAAIVVWSLLAAAALLATGWLGQRLCARVAPSAPAWLIIPAVLLIVRPVTSEFLLGQTDLFLGLLLTAWLFYESAHRPWRAALAVALAGSLKLPALLVLPYWATRGRWRSIGRTLLLFVAVNAPAALALSPANPFGLFAAWIRTLAASGPDRAFEIGNQSFLSLAGRLLRRDGYDLNLLSLGDSTVVLIALLLSLGLFGWLLIHRPRPSTPRAELIDGAIVIILSVLFSPTCWIATYTVLLFPVLLALALSAASIDRLKRSFSLSFAATIALALSVMTNSKFWKALGIRYFKGESYIYLVFMILPLLGLTLAWYLRQLRPDGPSPPRTSRS
jgi:hypothetical protein